MVVLVIVHMVKMSENLNESQRMMGSGSGNGSGEARVVRDQRLFGGTSEKKPKKNKSGIPGCGPSGCAVQ